MDSGVSEDITKDESKYKGFLEKIKEKYLWASNFKISKVEQETGGSHSIKLHLRKENEKED